MEGYLERKTIVWDTKTDRQLLSTVDEYIIEYGMLYEQDWQVISTFAFLDPRYLLSAKLRYEQLNRMKIRTLADYNSYQHASSKAAWVYSRECAVSTTTLSRGSYRIALKLMHEEQDAELQKDILEVKKISYFETILDRRMWEYLGGSGRVGIRRYMDLADKLIDRLPSKFTGNNYSVTRWALEDGVIVDNLSQVAKRFGENFTQRSERQDLEPLVLSPTRGIHLVNREPEGQLLCLRKSLDPEVTKWKMETQVNGLFSLQEWRQIFNVRDSWSAYGQGRLSPTWFGISHEYATLEAFRARMASTGVVTKKTREEVEMEFHAYVLPNYWLFFPELVEDQTCLEQLICRRSVTWVGNLACVTIYHTLTLVSVKHIRKTISYLIVCGAFRALGITPTEWCNTFVHMLIRLPCGECWDADPVEFEKVRAILKWQTEETDVTTWNNEMFPLHYWVECRRGKNCYWKQECF